VARSLNYCHRVEVRVPSVYPSIYLRFVSKCSLKSGDVEPDIHNLNSGWTCVVCSKSSLFFTKEKYPAVSCQMCLHHRRTKLFAGRKNLLQRIEFLNLQPLNPWLNYYKSLGVIIRFNEYVYWIQQAEIKSKFG